MVAVTTILTRDPRAGHGRSVCARPHHYGVRISHGLACDGISRKILHIRIDIGHTRYERDIAFYHQFQPIVCHIYNSVYTDIIESTVTYPRSCLRVDT